MTYVGDEKRLEHLARKSRERRITAEGLITPSLTWEDHLEIEAIEERQRAALALTPANRP
jgi:hypothetical protein